MMALRKAYRDRSSCGERVHILGAYNPLLSAQIRKAGTLPMVVDKLLPRSSAPAADCTRRGIAISCNIRVGGLNCG